MKSHFFAELGVERCLMTPGLRMVCIREVQKSLKESAKRLIEDKIEKFELSGSFKINNDSIITPGGGVILFQGMQDHTAESIKSLEGFDIAWAEEAQTLSAKSLEYLRPTIRKPNSELWFSWNPRSDLDPVDAFFRGTAGPPPNTLMARVSYEDNPWFPDVLEQERLHDLKHSPDRYAHIWLGEYEPTAIGAIWDRQIIHSQRKHIEEIPEMEKILVGVDPAVSSEEGSNEHGIIVAGLGSDQRGYILDDYTTSGSPRKWAQRVIAAFDRYEADAVVIEINQGGDMVRHTLQGERNHLPIREVRASKGKHVRAEPISALYHAGRISHVGAFPELERQLCQFTNEGYEGEGSPDRADALVWVLSELMPQIVRKKTVERELEYNTMDQGWLL